MPLETNFALIRQAHKGAKHGKKHLKVTSLCLVYFYCHREEPTSPLEVKGLFWQGKKHNNAAEKIPVTAHTSVLHTE